jgi:hypothetical protein
VVTTELAAVVAAAVVAALPEKSAPIFSTGNKICASHRNQNAGGHVLVMMTGDDMAHFARQNEGQRRVVKFQAPHAAKDRHDPAGARGRTRIGFVGDHELEARKAHLKVRVLAKGDLGQPLSEYQNPLVEGAIRGAFGCAAGRRIGGDHQLQAHVEFGVNGAESLQRRGSR